MADYEECTPEEFWEREQPSAPAPTDSQAEHDKQIRKRVLLELADELLRRPLRLIIPIDAYVQDAPLIARINVAAWLQAKAEGRQAPVISRLSEARHEHTGQWPPVLNVPTTRVVGRCFRRVGDGRSPDEHDGSYDHVRRDSCFGFSMTRRL